MCTIRYTLNPEYRNLSNPIKTLVGAAPVLLSHITPSNMYYFEFSVLMNETLLIVERMEYMITETGGIKCIFLIQYLEHNFNYCVSTELRHTNRIIPAECRKKYHHCHYNAFLWMLYCAHYSDIVPPKISGC